MAIRKNTLQTRKNGYAYFVELALAVIIIFIVLTGYIESEQTLFQYKRNQDLQESGWGILKNADYFGKLNTSNFSDINAYIAGSLNDFTDYDLELYNETGCFPVNNGVVSATNYTACPTINATTKNDIVSVFYTNVDGNVSAVRLYLWRKV